MLYDSHTHTDNSHDCGTPIDALCRASVSKGMSGVTIADHADTTLWYSDHIQDRITVSYQQAVAAKKRRDNLQIFAGIELGEAHLFTDRAMLLLSAFDFDVVLGSLHFLHGTLGFSDTDFSQYTKSEAEKILELYYDEMYDMASTCDFDVLTHLTYPLRYINGCYAHHIEIERYMRKMEEIFKVLLARNIALELNTSGIGTAWNTFMPQEEIIKLYKSLGGKLITLGSDAHLAEKAGNGFDEAFALLGQCGFHEYYYYKERKPVAVPIP